MITVRRVLLGVCALFRIGELSIGKLVPLIKNDYLCGRHERGNEEIYS